MDYKIAFKRPFTNPKILITLIVVYFFISLLSSLSQSLNQYQITIIAFVTSLIIFLFIFGYYLTCAKTAILKEYKLPEFKDLEKFFKIGFLSMIIAIIYATPLLILIAMIIAKLIPSTSIIVIILILGIITVITTAMAVLSYVYKQNLTDAFKFKEILKKSFKKKFILTLAISIIYSLTLIAFIFLIMFIFYGTITSITPPSIILYTLLSSIISVIMSITNMTLLGQTFREIS